MDRSIIPMTIHMVVLFGKFMKYQIETGKDLLPNILRMEHIILPRIKLQIINMEHQIPTLKITLISMPYM